MTIEQKAKSYDEAIERAKGIIEQNPLMEYLKKGIEYIFPELKESEDERIRNWLIGYFHQYKEDGMEKYANGLKVESIIAWLEKQSESYTKRDVDNAYIEGIAFAKDELKKQGEQKPADSHCSDCTNVKGCVNCTDGDMKETGTPAWSEEDEKRLNSCLNILQAKGLMGVTDTINSNWLKSIKERS